MKSLVTLVDLLVKAWRVQSPGQKVLISAYFLFPYCFSFVILLLSFDCSFFSTFHYTDDRPVRM